MPIKLRLSNAPVGRGALLRGVFFDLVQGYCADEAQGKRLWQEIVRRHSKKAGRRYHTLAHLDFMLSELNGVRAVLRNEHVVLFALFYHDAVYVPGNTDNEAQSAALAATRLAGIGFSPTDTQGVVDLILATRDHFVATSEDAAYFLDADLTSGLGRPWNAHQKVMQHIRQEYAAFSDAAFHAGRAQFIRQILKEARIFKTPHFFARFEHQARENLRRELLERTRRQDSGR
jgi:predicted metal-dependent HD superfamily phosphohydrolase